MLLDTFRHQVEIMNKLLFTFRPTLELNRFIHWTATNWKGHSKWQNIQHIKALKDGQKNVLFQKQLRKIRLAVQGLYQKIVQFIYL